LCQMENSSEDVYFTKTLGCDFFAHGQKGNPGGLESGGLP
jgi:hypothetical protein